MFLESLLETSPSVRTRRGMTTMASFAVQSMGLLVLLATPLFFPDALPLRIGEGVITAPTAPSGPDRTQAQEPVRLVPVPSELTATGTLIEPMEIPTNIYRPPKPEQAPPVGGGSGPSVPWATPGGGSTTANNVISDIVRTSANAVPVVKQAPVRPRISPGVSEGLLIHRVTPVYPRPATAVRVEGDVVLLATISASGTIESLRVAEGHPLLAPAALDAVRQWRYRPYMLGSEAVPVETQITVKFRLRTAQ